MAHYSYASPDRKSALIVEMDEHGGWAPCRLIPLGWCRDARPWGPGARVPPPAWSPDGCWMYFIAGWTDRATYGASALRTGSPNNHLWPAREDGLAVERDGRSVITSIGVHESAIWIHDADGERSLSSEGEVATTILLLLLARTVRPSIISCGVGRHVRSGAWRMTVDTGKAKPCSLAFPCLPTMSRQMANKPSIRRRSPAGSPNCG